MPQKVGKFFDASSSQENALIESQFLLPYNTTFLLELISTGGMLYDGLNRFSANHPRHSRNPTLQHCNVEFGSHWLQFANRQLKF